MPTYVYKFVKTGETIEVDQSFSDPALTLAVNPRTGRKMAVKKVFTPVGVTFRGEGFYKTDSRAAKPSSAKAGADAKGSESAAKADSTASGDKAPANGSTPKAEPAKQAKAKVEPAKPS